MRSTYLPLRSPVLFVASLAVLLSAGSPARAQTEVEKLFARTRGLNPTLRDYSAAVSAKADANLAIVPYHLTMNGTYYHKRPDKYKLDLTNAPSFLRKYPSVFGLNLPPLERYDCKMEETRIEGRPVAHLSMTPKVSGRNDIQRIELYFDRSNGTVPKFDTYYSQGHLFLALHWTEDHGYWVYREVDADFLFPSVTASLKANYSGYRFNQGLSDDLFKK